MRNIRIFLLWLSTIGAVWFIFSFLAIALLSINYPYHLEWMEGQSIDVVQRIVEGKSIYVEPSIEYVPFIYAPLYFYLSAASALIFGVDFFAARLVSLLSAIGIGAVIFCWIRKEGGDKRLAVISAGLFYATYILSSRWLDVARIDSLYVFLAVAALYILTHHKNYKAAIFAGLLLSAAFFTKQNTLIIIIPLLVIGIWQRMKHLLLALLIFLIATLLVFTAFNMATDGWFYFYIFDVPASHRIDKRFISGFWMNDLLANLWPLLILCAVGWFELWRTDRRKALYYLALAAGLIGTAYAGRLHRYGWTNVLIPAHLCLALCGIIALIQLQRKWKNTENARGLCTIFAGYFLVLLQFALLLYNPVYSIPSHDSVRKADEFMQKIASIAGDVFMPEMQFISTRVGKKSYTYGFAALDIFQSEPKSRAYVRDKLRAEIVAAISNQQFSAIITSGLISVPYKEEFYQEKERIIYPLDFVAGYAVRPFRIMLPMEKKLEKTLDTLDKTSLDKTSVQ